MLFDRVAARLLAGSKTIVDVPPMMRRDLSGIDADRFNRINDPQNPFDSRPALGFQQEIGRAHV